jgi:hypothetical protein
VILTAIEACDCGWTRVGAAAERSAGGLLQTRIGLTLTVAGVGGGLRLLIIRALGAQIIGCRKTVGVRLLVLFLVCGKLIP